MVDQATCSVVCQEGGFLCDREHGHAADHRGYVPERDQVLFWSNSKPSVAGPPPHERPPECVRVALAALESDATRDMRYEAFNALRDHFYPITEAALAVPREPDPLEKPMVLKHALTVIIDKDTSAAQADADVAAMKNGQMFTQTRTNSAYFHQLRLLVARDPTLASQICVFYRSDTVLVPIGLLSGDELRWPVGFENELLDIEFAVQKARRPPVALAVRPVPKADGAQ